MSAKKIMVVATATVLASAMALSSPVRATGQSVPIDYGSLFTGKKAPPDAKAKLKRAAQLAAKR